jgi:DNA repair protein RadA/Sms
MRAVVLSGCIGLARLQGRVLGGGLTRGSLTLLYGAPGIGKSTLLMQLAGSLAASGRVVQIDGHATTSGAVVGSRAPAAGTVAEAPQDAVVAYVSGEETLSQLKGRAVRLGVRAPTLLLLNEGDIGAVMEQLDVVESSTGAPIRALFVDSIQTAYLSECAGAPGGMQQVRDGRTVPRVECCIATSCASRITVIASCAWATSSASAACGVIRRFTTVHGA